MSYSDKSVIHLLNEIEMDISSIDTLIPMISPEGVIASFPDADLKIKKTIIDIRLNIRKLRAIHQKSLED